MAKRGVFKVDFASSGEAPDPVTVFRNLRGRASEIKYLWDHQAELLRTYHQECQKERDVALELPTGAGKTMVGLLIAEWRRQALGERVVYICPTKQLAKQVRSQSMMYGIRTHVFVGKGKEYSPQDFAEYEASQAIAVTNYSSIFNIKPRISDAQVLIFDDAHASEHFIAGMWSVEIQRTASNDLYKQFITLMRGGLPEGFYSDVIASSGAPTQLIEMVPNRHIRECIDQLRGLLDANLAEDPSNLYVWPLVKDHLNACCVYISYERILIRPFIPPTLTHAAFSQATQRVYMSATLGLGGELERITGIQSIKRIPVPADWEKRGSGRRLFLVPGVTLTDKDAMLVALGAARAATRSLILTPTHHEAQILITALKESGQTVLDAKAIEESLDPFTSQAGIALVLSRYDGIDLPDEDCRLLILAGLPCGTTLQEKFLWTRVAAVSLLRDRVLTRLTQGFGRCTRSDSDYATVILWGQKLVDFVLKLSNRRLLNPELQAELQFGIEICKGKRIDEFKELWEAFEERGDDWKDAESEIVKLRDNLEKYTDPISERLSAVVMDEIKYVNAMWGGDYEAGLQLARKVADALGGEETKGYRGWWHYLAADAAFAQYKFRPDMGLLEAAKKHLKSAAQCCTAISWFARLARPDSEDEKPDSSTEMDATAAEKILENLTEWGSFGKRFDAVVNSGREEMASTDYKAFHRGLNLLGSMLGFTSDLPEGTGTPDCIWAIGSDMYIVHEAKSDQTPGDSISVTDVRQASSHKEWLRSKRCISQNAKILCLIESPRITIDKEAVPHAKQLCHITPLSVGALFERAVSFLRGIRAKLSDCNDESLRELILQELQKQGLSPESIFSELSTQKAAQLPVPLGRQEKT